jgi:glycerol uptake facilitator-like aquaporin
VNSTLTTPITTNGSFPWEDFRKNRGELSARLTTIYIGAQVIGGILGVRAAHLMFELRLWQVSVTVRTGPGQWLAEAVATFGLVLTILGCSVQTPTAVPYAVGLYITAAYWLTASTSFANPAVTIARSLSDTFAGIAPAGVVAFVCAQFVGMVGAVVLARWLWPSTTKSNNNREPLTVF